MTRYSLGKLSHPSVLKIFWSIYENILLNEQNKNINKHTHTNGGRRRGNQICKESLIMSFFFIWLLMFIGRISVIIKCYRISSLIGWWWRTIGIWMISITKNRILINRKRIYSTYRLSELSRKPFANGLLSILSCVTYWIKKTNYELLH